MIDTHAHLNWPDFANTIDKVVQESQQAGLAGIIIASSNIEDSRISIKLAQKYPGYLFASIGIHPQQTDTENSCTIQHQLTVLKTLIVPARSHLAGTIVALGECGLDYSPTLPYEKDRSKEEQERLFRGQIDLSIKHNLPLIIHARQANDEVIQILSDYPQARGVFHCYSGGKKRVKKLLDLANIWYFGFDGNLTYDVGLQEVVKLIPPERLLIETDTPFLPPSPFRGQSNKPAYLSYIQKTINLLFQTDLTDQITNNSIALFNLPAH